MDKHRPGQACARASLRGYLLGLARDLVGLAAEVGRGGALALVEAGEERLEQRAEDDLCAAVKKIVNRGRDSCRWDEGRLTWSGGGPSRGQRRI